MTDKEIMIDGVDVYGCKYYLRNTHKNCGVGLVDCEGKDCMFKQLAHKTAECEELKNIINKSAEKFCTDYLDTIEENKKLKDELSVIQHNCNRNGCKYYDDDTFKVFYNCKAKIKCEKYEQTLFEIKTYCKTALCVSTSKNDINFIQMIIDIINKAKGGEDKQ